LIRGEEAIPQMEDAMGPGGNGLIVGYYHDGNPFPVQALEDGEDLFP
jgi:hypothetical protein